MWYYLYLDDLFSWFTNIETVEKEPVNIVHKKIEITDSFIIELKQKLKEHKKKINC